MLHNSVLEKDVDKEDITLFSRVWNIILDCTNYLKEYPDGQGLKYNCHSICRALAHHVPEVTLVDGFVIGFELSTLDGHKAFTLVQAEHSWLVLPKGAIMDPYPVGIMPFNPLLVVTKGEMQRFGGNLYMPDAQVIKIIDTPEMHAEIEANIAQMAKVIAWTKLQNK